MRRFLFSTIGMVFLSGCTTLQSSPLAFVAVSPQQLVVAVECELARAYSLAPEQRAFLSRWVAGSDLTLKDDDSVSVKPGLTLTGDFNDVGVTLTPSAEFSSQGARSTNVKFDTITSDLAPNSPKAETIRQKCLTAGTSIDASKLGLADWFVDVAQALGGNDRMSKVKSLQYDAKFTITRAVGGGFELKVLSAELKINEKDLRTVRMHHLVIDFAINEVVAAKTPQQRIATTQAQRDAQRNLVILQVDPDLVQ